MESGNALSLYERIFAFVFKVNFIVKKMITIISLL